MPIPKLGTERFWPAGFGWFARGRTGASLGDRGERLAERYLRRRGMKIVGRQVRVGGGELDLIAVQGRTIVFVEVKTRSSAAAGHPLEAVTSVKQARLTRAALVYLRRHDLLECAVRFDVVAVILAAAETRRRGRPKIIHVPHAFEPPGSDSMFA